MSCLLKTNILTPFLPVVLLHRHFEAVLLLLHICSCFAMYVFSDVGLWYHVPLDQYWSPQGSDRLLWSPCCLSVSGYGCIESEEWECMKGGRQLDGAVMVWSCLMLNSFVLKAWSTLGLSRINMALNYWGILKCLIADHLGSDQKLLLEGVENLTPKQKIK